MYRTQILHGLRRYGIGWRAEWRIVVGFSEVLKKTFKVFCKLKFLCIFSPRRDGRAVECGGLENRWGVSLRGFESLSLRRNRFPKCSKRVNLGVYTFFLSLSSSHWFSELEKIKCIIFRYQLQVAGYNLSVRHRRLKSLRWIQSGQSDESRSTSRIRIQSIL